MTYSTKLVQDSIFYCQFCHFSADLVRYEYEPILDWDLSVWDKKNPIIWTKEFNDIPTCLPCWYMMSGGMRDYEY